MRDDSFGSTIPKTDPDQRVSSKDHSSRGEPDEPSNEELGQDLVLPLLSSLSSDG